MAYCAIALNLDGVAVLHLAVRRKVGSARLPSVCFFYLPVGVLFLPTFS